MYTKTRISALVLAIVMVASMFTAFPAIVSAADNTWTQTYTNLADYDHVADMVMSGPTKVVKGETFEVSFTFNNYETVLYSYNVNFEIDTRYLVYDTEYDSAKAEITPPCVVTGHPDDTWELIPNGLSSGAYIEATDKSAPKMANINFGAATYDRNNSCATEPITVTVRLKAVANGTATFAFGDVNVMDKDRNDSYISDIYMEEGGIPECTYTVTVVDETVVDSSEDESDEPVVGGTWTQTYTNLADYDHVADMVMSGPTKVVKGETFEVSFTFTNYETVLYSYNVNFEIDTRYLIYDTEYDSAKAEITPPCTVTGHPDDTWELIPNGLSSGAYIEATDKSAPKMANINFGAATYDRNNSCATEPITVTVRLKAVATGTATFAFGDVNVMDKDRNDSYISDIYMEEGGIPECTYTVTVVDGAVEDSSEEPAPTEYTVTFIGFEGKLLDEQTVVEGGAAVAPEAPEVRGYTFKGWDVAFDNITADTTVTAIYEAITYTVYFQDKDGNVFAQETVEYGKAATAPEAPVVEGYDFTGWDVDFSEIYGDTYVTAQYEIKTFTVTFVGYAGEILKEETVEYGAAATAPEAPAVENHTFTGWDVAFDNITGDLTVNAKYLENMPTIITVTFVGMNGEFIGSVTVEEGGAVTAPAAPEVEGYTFMGWDKALDNVTSDITVNAVYVVKTFTVTFVGKDGETLKEETVDYGAAATAPEAPVVEGYDFTGWDVAFDSIKAETTVNAIYTIKTFTVEFVLTAKGTSDDTLTFTVDYGTAWSEITVPTVTSANAAYAFTGWDKEFPATVTENITITAQYETTGATVTITFEQGENGTIIGTDDAGATVVGTYSIVVSSGVAAGSAFVTPDVVADDNYHFAGWYVDGELYDFNTILEGDVTLTAKFELNSVTFGDFVAEAVGGSGVANAKLYVNLNDGVVPENATVVFFYQTGDGRTSITIQDLTVKTDDVGAYIQMAIVPGSYASFDAYIVDGDIDFSATDWNVIDIITAQIIPAA